MRSYWQQRSFDRKPDLIVVGAGIIGCFSALFYKQQRPRHRVIVLERGLHPDGATVKNAGFACFGSPTELLSDIKQEGEDVAMARVDDRWQGLALLRRELTDDGIGYDPSGGFEVFKDAASFDEASGQLQSLNQLLKPILGAFAFKSNTRAATLGMGPVQLIGNDLEGQVDSGKLMLSLLHKCQENGVEFRFNTEVLQIERSSDAAILSVSKGQGLDTAQVLIATNGYTGGLMELADLSPARGQVLITAPINDLKLRGCFHLDRGFYYFRDVGNRVLLGGGRELDIEGETTRHEETTPRIQQALEELLRTMILPGKDVAIAHRWSGIMGVGKEKSPIVQRMNDHVVVAVRLGGMGIAIGSKVAQRAVALMLG